MGNPQSYFEMVLQMVFGFTCKSNRIFTVYHLHLAYFLYNDEYYWNGRLDSVMECSFAVLQGSSLFPFYCSWDRIDAEFCCKTSRSKIKK